MKKIIFWIIAIIVTISAAVYQRMTGPTYPIKGEATLNSTEISYRLARSHEVDNNYKISIQAQNPDVTGYVLYKRYKTNDPWTKLQLTRENDSLSAELPHQPPAGKLAYKVVLSYAGKDITLGGESPVIIRFKGKVPLIILLPHVLIMFLAMLFSNRAGIEALSPKGNPEKYVPWVLALMFAGGLILGPLVQKFAFGAYWTGFPLGYDLTDNKTLIAFAGWLLAFIAVRRGKQARWWVLGASILVLVVYLIPHSLLGSELKYSQINPPQVP